MIKWKISAAATAFWSRMTSQRAPEPERILQTGGLPDAVGLRRRGSAFICQELPPDIVLLDIMMPKMDGLMVCRETRKESNIPIIMLTAKGEEFDSCWDWNWARTTNITKPFSPREVLARVKAVLRRIHEMKEVGKGSHLVAGNLDIDMSAFIVKLNGKIVPCTPKEIEILGRWPATRAGVQPGTPPPEHLGLRFSGRHPRGGQPHQKDPREALRGRE